MRDPNPLFSSGASVAAMDYYSDHGLEDYSGLINGSNWTSDFMDQISDMGNMVKVPVSMYSMLILFGVIGNAIVLVMMLRILIWSQCFTNVYVYVLCLSATDLIYLLSAVLQISYLLEGFWMFGWPMCKIMYICEAMNKSMSIYLLVMLTADRYFAVCHPTSLNNLRTIKNSMYTVLVFALVLSVLNTPFYLYARAKPLCMDRNSSMCLMDFPELDEMFPALFPSHHNDSSTTNSRDCINSELSDLEEIQVEKINPWMSFGTYHTLFMITFYHAIPGLLMIFCSVSMLLRIREQYHVLRKTSSRRNRVTLSIIAVVCFYVVCWTPYWTHQVFLQVLYHDALVESPTGLYMTAIISTFPYISASINPIFYAFLNKTLRQAYSNTVKNARKRRFTDQLFRFSTSTYSNNNSPSLKRPSMTTKTSRTFSVSTVTQTSSKSRLQRAVPKHIQALRLQMHRRSILSTTSTGTSASLGILSNGSVSLCGKVGAIDSYYTPLDHLRPDTTQSLMRDIVPEEVSGALSSGNTPSIVQRDSSVVTPAPEADPLDSIEEVCADDQDDSVFIENKDVMLQNMTAHSSNVTTHVSNVTANCSAPTDNESVYPKKAWIVEGMILLHYDEEAFL